MQDYFVVDIRNGRVLGPYTHADAQKLAVNLNDFIRRNAGLKPAFVVRQ